MDREARNNAPPPTIAYLRGQGVTGARVSCRNVDCGRSVTVPFDNMGLPEGTPFPQIARLRKWVCQSCKGRQVWGDAGLARPPEGVGRAKPR